ncbi:hypothetical protein [Mycoplasmopsis cynos]|uniref:hypothetical protein n=1 Tax=Mycoplasmopsis cynos TaxID=171284 RepID=UPI0021FA380B|nr:hypothetical protein [Mycoplasmopsis cynos]UWV92042.1 hypothetical protein NWE57_03795 [Mycoplasmopsis cynos]
MRLVNNKRNNQNQKPQIKKKMKIKQMLLFIVTPLVLIPTITAAGFGIWYALKHRKKSD